MEWVIQNANNSVRIIASTYCFIVSISKDYTSFAMVSGLKAITKSVFSPAKIEGVGERHILGGASVHINGVGSTPIPHQRQKTALKGSLGGPYPLRMLGRTLQVDASVNFTTQRRYLQICLWSYNRLVHLHVWLVNGYNINIIPVSVRTFASIV